MAKISSITADPVNWTFGGTTSVNNAGQFVLPATADYSNNIISVATDYDLTDSSIICRLAQTPNAGTGTIECWMLARAASGDYYAIGWNNNAIFLQSYIGGVYVENTENGGALNTSNRWLRLRESGGTVYWDTSPNGRTWTNMHSRVADFAITSLRVELGAGFWGTETDPGTAIFDHINVPTMPPTQLPLVDYTDPNSLYPALLSDNPIANNISAREVAIARSTPSTDIDVNFYNKFYKNAGHCGNYKELTVTFQRNAVGSATITLDQLDPLVDVVMKCWEEVVPVTIKTGYMKWTGRVEYVDYGYKDGKYDIVVYCTSDYQWFDKILCWPDFLLPIQAQFPSRALYIGPAITCIKALIAEQTFRLQSGIWEFVNNALSLDLDWRAWFGTALESDGNFFDMLMMPIVVVPTDPIFDTSPWTSINGRMDKISTLVEQVVKDNGLVLSADLWLPGDPQPAGLFATLTAPTIVVDVKDRSGVTGPTGTFIDGLITDVVDLQHSVLGDVLTPFLNPGNEFAPEGVNIAPTLGVNFVQPWVIFTDHERGGLREYHLIPHSPLAYTIIGGGKSPHWLNDLINATLEWLIDSIEIAIGFTGVPDSLLDGTFDDIILAFQLIENADRRIKLGPYGFPEFFQQTGASAYTLDEWFALQSAMWDTRGYHGIIVSFDNGFPYTVGKDIFVGGLASFVCRGKLYTDYVERVTITDSSTERVKTEVMIGDGKSHDDPVVKIQRKITKAEEAFQIVTLSSNN